MSELINPFEYPPTAQQIDCVNKVLGNRVVKIDAIAGSGKTSSLELVAHNLKQKSLYLTFSKVLVEEAKDRFPPWVECRTIHSLAFRAEGRFYSHKLNRPDGKYKNVAATGKEIADFFKMRPVMVEEGIILSTAWLGLMVKKTLAKYEASADEYILDKHLPKKDIQDKLNTVKAKVKNKESLDIFTKIHDGILKYAGQLWEERINPDSDVLITHDTYVKMFALTQPYLDYDVIYIDEAQDVSEVMLSIVKNQDHAKLVFVGDRDQNIYSWRHSINAMAEVDCVHGELTQSFRYGKELADIASKILGGREVKGFDKVDTKVDFSGLIKNDKYTKIFRTNGALLSSALKLIQEGKRLNIETDLGEFIVMLKSAKALFKGKLNQVKHEEILPYLSWAEFVEEAENDPSLERIASIVEANKADHYLAVLRKHKNVTNPDIIFVTAHKAKGREFSNVILAEDFNDGYEDGVYKGLSEEEKRLLYVAATRAIDNLEYNEAVANIIAGIETEASKMSHNTLPVGITVTPVSNYDWNPFKLPHPKGEMAQDAMERAFSEEESFL
ncbi:MAG: putative F-box DNA helicase protein 1 [Prokaryotic dsDNA virus sp.]|nr:MAG: putative F-box DNA helicase protein 1 [Prokaryotic dsDNA virus sp.]|tara:strand:- start:6840 stop:8507 length:1668 start_codon:yes stop_codon:yes gene_type:complete